MKHTDNVVPYILASMHPLLHMSLLTSTIVLTTYDQEGFFKVPELEQCKVPSVIEFDKSKKYHLVGLISFAHLLAIIFHYLNEIFIIKNRKIFANIALIAKVFIYTFAQFYVQTGIILPDCRNSLNQSQVVAWLSYEVCAFYMNITAVGIFLLFSTISNYKSVKDRVTVQDKKESTDFLAYCKDDICWFQSWFTQIMLLALALIMRTKVLDGLYIALGLLAARFLAEAVVLQQFYYNQRFEVHIWHKILLVIIFLMSCYMIKIFLDFEKQHSIWVAPLFLQDLVLHLYFFVQLIIEWSWWEQKEKLWANEFVFNRKFTESEQNILDESQLIQQLEGDQFSVMSEYKQHQFNNALKQIEKFQPKNLKITANIYSISYCAFMVQSKKKHRLKENDQIDILFRALFTFIVQMTFIVTILFFEKFNFEYKQNAAVNVCLFFTSLLLHWQFMPDARNGIYMMRYVLAQPEEFTHPCTAFLLAFIQIGSVWIGQICNLMKSMDMTKPEDVIVRYVGFGLILQSTKLLTASYEIFEGQKCFMGTLALKKNRRESFNQLTLGQKFTFGLLHFVYTIIKYLYVSVYYYFFPFVVIYIPMIKLTYLVKLN